MSKIIPFSQLAKAQHLHFLEHKRREYQEREDYLQRLRRLLFQIEAQMRQAEVLQLDLFQQTARHFNIQLNFPSQGDRLAMQRFLFFADRLTPEECLEKIKILTKTE